MLETAASAADADLPVNVQVCQWFSGIMLPHTVRVGKRVRIDNIGGMVLVAQAIGDDLIVRQNTTFEIGRLTAKAHRPVFGDGVEIGAGVVIVDSIHIGDGVVIGANAVVTESVPAHAVAGGVPARELRMQKASDGGFDAG